MKKSNADKYIWITLILILAVLFLIKFSTPVILKLYIETGIGNCHKIPIMCMAPDEAIINPAINKEYVTQLVPYKFSNMVIYAPRNFSVVQREIKKVFYKKGKQKHKGDVIYLLYEPPDFFVGLFPQLKRQGIIDDSEFIKRTMYARISQIKNITDTFFVIMKGIFLPDLGDQHKVKMASFEIKGIEGFVNYNLSAGEHYFDFNIINKSRDFFKVYIKDVSASLSLENALAIISTLRSAK